MSDCPKCTLTTSIAPTVDCQFDEGLAGALYAAGSIVSPLPPDVEVSIPSRYSIRIAEVGEQPCSFCGRPTGQGPVGYFDDEPICDRCLDSGSFELATVLSLIVTTRLFALGIEQEPRDRKALAQGLERFALFFESVARSWGPARPFDGQPS